MDIKAREYLEAILEEEKELRRMYFNLYTGTEFFDRLTPIEQLMYVALLGQFGFDEPQYAISPQHQIGKFRVDFFVQSLSPHATVIVECDGHDYHEKTKAQASNDKRRDRELKMQGYDVLRYTGSDIWRDPRRCADEVWKFISNKSNG